MSGSGAGDGTPERRHGGGLGRPNRGNDGCSSRSGQGGRRDGATNHPRDGTSSSSSSTAGSNADQSEIKVVAGKKQVTTSLVDVSSSAERLSKLIVTDDRGSPVSSYLVLARTSAMATAPATAKATLDDSVKRAYVKIGGLETHCDFKRRFVSC